MPRAQPLLLAEADDMKASLCSEPDCPLLDAPAQASFRDAVKSASAFSMKVAEFLGRRTPAEQTAWVRRSLEASRPLFQPWTMEVVYAIAAGSNRFTAIQQLLGLSSRTLSERLTTLQEAGLLKRIVENGPPLRTSYRLTKAGRATAALASPLFAHLNQARNATHSG